MYSVISQKIEPFLTIAMKTSNPAEGKITLRLWSCCTIIGKEDINEKLTGK
jgi:hypothetical protein